MQELVKRVRGAAASEADIVTVMDGLRVQRVVDAVLHPRPPQHQQQPNGERSDQRRVQDAQWQEVDYD